MPTRLSTAEILAAARAADGKRSAPKTVAVPAAKVEPAPEPVPSVPESPIDATATEAAQPDTASDGPHPPTIAAILRKVRQDRTGDSSLPVPPPVRGLLDAVRSNGRPAEARPASMTAILQQVREICGTSGSAARPAPAGNDTVSRPAASGTASAPNAAKRPSTAEILAAARKNAKPAATTAEPTPAAKPATKASSTADILAAARRQGAGTGGGAARSTKPKPRLQTPAATNAPTTKKSVQAAPPGLDVSDGKPRPPAMAELLASVRSGTLERQAGIEYPPLTAMLGELRRLDRRAFSHATTQRPANSLVARIRRWLSGSDTHQGASI